MRPRARAPAESGRAALTGQGSATLVALCAVAVILGPLLVRPGVALSYDMVMLPDPPLHGRLLGLGHELPRAVPSDAVLSIAGRILPMSLVQDLLLGAALVLAGLGAARLVPAPAGWGPRSLGAARAGAGLAAVWNPFVAERLVLGQWALLLGYGALPWVVRAAAAFGSPTGPSSPVAAARLMLAMVPAAVGGAGAMLIGGLPALPVAVWAAAAGAGAGAGGRPGGGTVARAGGGTVARAGGGAVVRAGGSAVLVLAVLSLLSLPWAVPALLQPTGLAPDPAGPEVFAPRADTALGAQGSLLALGAVWNAGVVPPGRGSVLVAALTVLWLAVVAVGVLVLVPAGKAGKAWRAGRAGGSRTGAGRVGGSGWLGGLGIAAAAGLAVAVAGTLSVARPIMGWIVTELPGGGLLRDSSKLVAPWALLACVAAGCGAVELGRRVSPRAAAGVTAACLLALPVALAPALAWGASGRLEPVRLPESWHRARAVVDAAGNGAVEAPGEGADGPSGGGAVDAAGNGVVDADWDGAAVLVLPWSAYRAHSWNDRRQTLDMASRWFDARVLADDRLVVNATTLAPEDPELARLSALAADGPAMRRAAASMGAGWVLVERDTPGSVPAGLLDGLPVVIDAPDLGLYRLAPTGPVAGGGPSVLAVITADAACLLAIAIALSIAGAAARPSAVRRRDGG